VSESHPLVSIGIPIFNAEEFLADALESLLGQTLGDFELLISDNASTDGTEEIGRAFAARDPRIQYVRNTQNLGASPNFNRVLEMARGKYFKCAAHDDLCEPTYLEKCVSVLEGDKEAVHCFTGTKLID